MKVAAYLRVSTEEQDEKNISLPAQKSRLIQYCKAQEWDIYDFYIDPGHTGKNLDRPDMKRLITDAKHKKFDVVLVIKLDRLSRRQQHVMYLLEDIFTPNNIGFSSVTENFNTTTPAGRMMIGVMAAFAQLERETIVERVTDAKRETAKQGRYMGGVVPFGYAHNPVMKSIEINPIQAEVIKMIYDEYLKRQSGYQAIADMLNDKKIRAPRIKYWGKEAIRKILSNPCYAGYLHHKGNTYKGKHDAIIPTTKWEEIQEMLHGRTNVFSKPGTYLLSGNIFCGECNARMRSKTVRQVYPKGSPPTRYYVCYSQDGSAKHMVKDEKCKCGYKHADKIEEYVVNKLKYISEDEESIKKIQSEMIDAVDKEGIEVNIVRSEKEIVQLQNKIDRWYDAYEREEINAEVMGERVKTLHDKRYFLENNIIELQQELILQSNRATSAIEFIKALRNFKDIWDNGTPEEQKSIINFMVQSVTVYKDDHIVLSWPD